MINYKPNFLLLISYLYVFMIINITQQTCLTGADYVNVSNSGSEAKEYINKYVPQQNESEIIASLGQKIKLLGSGGFGNVYLFKDTNKQEVAVKVMKKNSSQLSDRAAKDIFEELNANFCIKQEMQQFPDIDAKVVLFEKVRMASDTKKIFMVMKKYDSDMYDYIKNNNRRGWNSLGNVAKIRILKQLIQLTQSLNLFYKSSFLHRDIKPENILVDEFNNAYISDLGLFVPSGVSNGVGGTPTYIDPMMMVTGQTNLKADIFSMGVTYYFMVNTFSSMGRINKNIEAQIKMCKLNKNMCTGNFLSFPSELSFLNKMGAMNPNERPKPSDILPKLEELYQNYQQNLIVKKKEPERNNTPILGGQRNQHNVEQNFKKKYIPDVLRNKIAANKPIGERKEPQDDKLEEIIRLNVQNKQVPIPINRVENRPLIFHNERSIRPLENDFIKNEKFDPQNKNQFKNHYLNPQLIQKLNNNPVNNRVEIPQGNIPRFNHQPDQRIIRREIIEVPKKRQVKKRDFLAENILNIGGVPNVPTRLVMKKQKPQRFNKIHILV